MFRYLALSWNPSSESATAVARAMERQLKRGSSGWRSSLDTKGLKVFHFDARGSTEVYELTGQRGVVLGTLFQNDPDAPYVPEPRTFSVEDSQAIVESGGKWLVNNRWGRYCAIVRNPQSGSTFILRDPLGILPCFITEYEGVSVCCSDTNDYFRLGLTKFTTNWRYVRVYCCYPQTLQTHATGYNEVSEVQPGECWELRANGSTHQAQYWDPASIARDRRVESYGEFIRQLRRHLVFCVGRWASLYPSLIHALSGGLDSSGTAMCLEQAPSRPEITYFTFFNRLLKTGDERDLARIVARMFNHHLEEIEEIDAETSLAPLLQLPPSARPWKTQYPTTHSHFEYSVAKKYNAKGRTYGCGGDELGYRGPIPEIVGDRHYDYGYSDLSSTLSLGLDVARARKMSLWSVLAKARRDRANPQIDLAKFGQRTDMILPEVAQAASQDDYLQHVWLQNAHGLPLGKLMHIRQVGTPYSFYDPFSPQDGPEPVNLLLSQPLAELFFRKPTYDLAAHGRDRFAVRLAFEGRLTEPTERPAFAGLPKEIVWRYRKGLIDQHFQKILRVNNELARGLMLGGGYLIKERILDRGKVEPALSGGRASFGREAADLAAVYLGIEAWVRSCQESQRNARPLHLAAMQ